MRKRNWLKTTIAMITLIATVLETGFTSVSTLAAEITTEDGIVVNNDAVEEVNEDAGSEDLDISVERERDSEDVEDADYEEEEAVEEAAELKEGSLSLSDDQIAGSGYDEISIYVDTEGMDLKDLFRLEFEGPASASYNPIINDDLDKTNGGRYDFEFLEGGDFTVRAVSSDDVTFSYRYNEDGYPTIVVESIPAEKILETTTVTRDGEEIEAISGEGFDKITVTFNCEELSDSASYKLYVDSDAHATVDGLDAAQGIDGLANDVLSLEIENLDEESFKAYVVSDNDEVQIKSIVDIDSVEDGVAVITVDNYNTKREYKYEDDKVKVMATLEKADAVPDDAYFDVTPLTEEEAEAYLAVLNEDLEEGQEEYTADNTLLYNIGFYTDETKSEEIEPEEGSVRIAVEFKKDQLEKDLGVETSSDVEVTHFAEEGQKIEAEKLEVAENPNEGVVEVVTESFSVFAFKGNGEKKLNVSEPGTESAKGLLDDAWLYGITADTWKFNGEAETSFAVNTLTGVNGALNGGQTGVNSSKAEGSNYQYSMVGHVDGSTRIKGFDVELTIPNNEKSRITHESGNTHIKYVGLSQNSINKRVNAMLTYVKEKSSSRIAGYDSLKDSINTETGKYSGLPQGDSAKKITIDITDAKAGTYYIDADKYDALKAALKESSGLTLIKNADQKLVINYTSSTDVTLQKFSIKQGDQTYDSTSIANMSSGKNPIVEDIIFNLPKATKVEAHDFAGILMAPEASVTFHGVGGGWLVCKTAISDAEWHFVNGRIPDPERGKITVKLPVEKIFEGGAGKWGDGFQFKLERLNEHWSYAVNNDWQTPQTITINGKDKENGSGEFTLEFDDTEASEHKINWWTNEDQENYAGYELVHTEWYKVTELDAQRSDVEQNVIDPTYDEKGNKNSDYWFVHLFIYKDEQNPSNLIYASRTARINPVGYDYSKGLPCEEDRIITFKNRYKTNYEVEFNGIKKVNGNEVAANSPEDGKFTFKLYEYNTKTGKFDILKDTKTNVGKTIKFDKQKLSLNDAHHMSKKVFGKAHGFDFYYLIQEEECAPYTNETGKYIAWVSVNTIFNTVTVKYVNVTDEGSFSLTTLPTFPMDTFAFNNKLVKEGETVIHGLKQLENKELKAGDYTFTLTSTDDPKFADDYTGDDKYRGGKNSATNDADGFFDFGTMKFTDDDVDQTYTYTLAEAGTEIIEVDGKQKRVMAADHNIECLTEPYTFTIKVTDNGTAKLSVENTYDDPAKDKRATFNNVYSAKGSITFGVSKEFGLGENVTALPTDKKFTFVINGGRVADEKGNAVNDETFGDTLTIPGDKQVHPFKTIEYKNIKKLGTYKYTIQEDTSNVTFVEGNKGNDGITYDRRVYHVTVVVTDNGDGTLATAYNGAWDKDPADTDAYADPTFVNTYDVKPATKKLEGEKYLADKTLKRKQFTFELKAVDKDGNDATYDAVTMPAATTVKNGENAEWNIDYFSFGDITFNKAGTYYFAVNEVQDVEIDTTGLSEEQIAAEKKKYGFDDTVYIAKIEVSDNGSGQLVAEDPVYTPSATYGRMRFSNTYNGVGGTHLYAKKIYQYPKAAPDWVKSLKFDFKLTSSDDTKNLGADGITIQNNGELVDFGLLKYDSTMMVDANGNKVDKKQFRYTIEEVITADVKAGNGILNGVYYGLNSDFDITKPLSVTSYKDIIVTVTRNSETGELNAVPDTDHNAGSQNGTNVIFRNKFYAKGDFRIDGSKILTGRKFDPNDNFRVQLKDPNGNIVDLKDANGNSLNPVKITPVGEFDGVFAFENIKVDYATIEGWKKTNGQYVFTVEELQGGGAEVNGKPVKNDPHTIFYVVVNPQFNTATGKIDVPYVVYRDEALSVKAEALSFVNTYDADGKTQIRTVKEFKNGKLEGGDFEYVLRDEEGNEVKTSNDVDGNVNFGSIKYDYNGTVTSVLGEGDDAKEKTLKAGVSFEQKKTQEFTYTVSEKIDESRKDVEWPKHAEGAKEVALFTVIVTVKDDGSGKLDISKVYNDLITGKTFNSEEAFLAQYKVVNKYKATGFVYIPATKIFDADIEFPADTFKFILTDKDGNKVEKPVDSSKKVSFNNKDNDDPTPGLEMLRFDESDLDPTKSDLIYDGKDGVNPETYAKYYTMTEWHPQNAVLGTAEIKEGDTVKQIPVYRDDKGYVYDAREYSIMVTLVNNGEGKIETEYYAYEKGSVKAETSKEGWLKELYKTVRDAVKDIFGMDVDGKTIKFVNDYESTGSLVLSAKKIMEKLPAGKSLKDYGFQFRLSGKKENGEEFSETVDVLDDGIAAFTKLEYTKASKKGYEYTIEEVIPNDPTDPDKTAVLDEATGKYVLNGVYYDPAKYTVKVTVSENSAGADGHLTVAYVVTKDGSDYTPSIVEVTVNGETVKDAVQVDFTNVYDVKPIEIKLGGLKKILGRELTAADKFEFTMESVKEEGFGYKQYSDKQTNDEKGLFEFKPLTFELNDLLEEDGKTYAASKTFVYEVNELVPENDNDKIAGVTYVNTPHRIEITVENTPDAKDAAGKLTYSITSNGVPVVYPVAEGSEEAQLKITYAIATRFNNKYQAEGDLVLPVKKIIEEAPNDPNKTFDFELKGVNGTVIKGQDNKTVEGNKLVVTGVKSGETKSFDAIHYDFADLKKEGNVYKNEYDYEVTETSKSTGENDPYTYSEEVYTVHVTVETDGSSSVLSEENGSIKYDIKYKEKPAATEAPYTGDAMLFTNHFKAEGSVPIEIIKKMVNQPLDTGRFSFKLVDVETGEEIPVNKSGAGTLKWETVGKGTDNGATIATRLPIAVSEFLGATLKYDLSDLKDGDTYNTEAVKKYTLEEVQNNVDGVLCSTAIYDIEVTIKNDYSGKLDVQKTVKLRDGSVSKAVVVNPENSQPSLLERFWKFVGFGPSDAEATSPEAIEEILEAREGKALFVNAYDSKCVIDPPILYKQMVGKELEVGDFKFLLEGPGLRSAGEDVEAKNEKEGYLNGHSVYTWNGMTPDGSRYYPDGRGLIPADEIYVGEIQYTYNDLIDYKFVDDEKLATLKPGEAERTFVYYATEVAPDQREDGMDYSLEDFVKEYGREPQKYMLRVRAVDNGKGGIDVYNAKDEKVDFKTTHFFWEPVSNYALSDEQMSDTFLNRYNREGSVTIPGIKEMIGRELTENDVFQFKITDVTPGSKTYGQSAYTENITNSDHTPSTIEFRPEGDDKIAGNDDDISFLKFREGAFVVNEDEVKADPNAAVKLVEVDDTKVNGGIHEFLIEETDKYDGVYEGVTRRTDKFKVRVKVSRDGEIVNNHGHLKADILDVYIVPESGTEYFFDPEKFVFKNDFKASNKISISGKKYVEYVDGSALESKESLLNQYEFAVYQYTDASRKSKTGGPVATCLTDADGNFTLDIPEYTQELLKKPDGKYDKSRTLYYQIVEVKPVEGTWSENNTLFESEGVIFDMNSYDMDVVVSYDGTTTLKVEKKILDNKTKATLELSQPNSKKDHDEEVEFIKFTNKVKKYKVIEGNKYWIDNFKDPLDRPEITVNLYRRTASGVEAKINSYTIVPPDTTYRFNTDSEGKKLPTTDSAGRPISYIVEETPIEGYLSEKINYDFYNTKEDILIRKIDADTRETLSGATLAILDGSTEVERWTSGVSAHVVETQLTAGKTYTLHEVSAPEGYGVADDMTFTVPSDGSGITVTMSDPPIIGSVRLTKVDASTRETLAGAEFALYNEAGTRIYATGSAGSYSVTTTTSNGVFVTDASGSLTISDLPYGTYYFVETKAPDGYALSSERLGFTILRGGELVEVTYVNTKAVGSVRLRKVGSARTRGLAGAVFELYAATPRSIGQAASSTIFSDAYYRYGTYRTNADGEIYVGDLPWDDYYFVEVDAPDGYTVMTDVNGDDLAYTFRIDAASTDRTIELGDIINNPEEETPPPRGGVLGERVKRGGVVNGVLGVRAKPNSGVLGERIGPVTGDASNIILWSLLLAACIATIVATVLTGRKKKAAK